MSTNPPNDTKQYTRVQAQFSKTASAYATSNSHAKGQDLTLMVEVLTEHFSGDLTGKDILDVATGAGHTALALARAHAKVIATDITPEMLELTRQQAQNENLNLRVQQAAAEDLPFAQGSFDAITCRIAAHHFVNISAFLNEAARLLRPAGCLIIIDNIVPENKRLAETMNAIEKTRDPSHVRALSLREWLNHAADCAFDCMHLTRWQRRKNFADWCARAQLPQLEQVALEQHINALDTASKAYFGVEYVGERLQSLCHEAALLAFVKR